MQTFARIVDGVAVEIVAIPDDANIFNHYHHDIAKQFRPVDGECEQGWVLYQGTMVDPWATGYRAAGMLAASDGTMMRIGEAVSLGLTSWDTADVAAWIEWRRALRSLLDDHAVGEVPERPAFPAGT